MVIKFKTLLNEHLLQEELSNKAKRFIKNNFSFGRDSQARSAHDRVFGKNDKIIVPVDEPEHKPLTTLNYGDETFPKEHAHFVINQLSHHGYETDDYDSGLVYHEDAPTRKIKIGKVINKIDPDEAIKSFDHFGSNGNRLSLKQVYDADPRRAAKSAGGKQIVFTRDPYEVAGMSTEKGWTSCMNLSDGCNRHRVQNDLTRGTIAAYITPKGDDSIKKAIGRVSIKQFEGPEDSIWRSEGIGYGTVLPHEKKQIAEWAEKNFPAKEDTTYIKSGDLYNDNSHSIIFPDSGKLHSSAINSQIETNVDQLIKHYRDTPQNLKGYHDSNEEDYDNLDDIDYHSIENDIHSRTHSLLHTLPKRERILHAFHYIRHDPDESPEKDLNHYEDYAESYLKKNAHDYIDSSVSDNEIKNNLTPTESFEEHEKFDKNAKDHRGIEDENPKHVEAHSGVIQHVLSHGTEHQKDKILSDISEHEQHDSTNYYHQMFHDYQTDFDHSHPVEFTKNPDVMRKILDSDVTIFPKHEIDSDSAFHMGVHADHDLTEYLTTGNGYHHMNPDTMHHFVDGLNKNPHGERIQHDLISGFNMTGGHNDDQSTRFDRTHGGRTNHRESWIDPSSDERSHELYKSIAETTKFPSVHETLKHRYDTKDDPEIQDSLKANSKF